MRRLAREIDNKNYDYVVIGIGPAGCVAANGLIDRGKSVLLLEGGSLDITS